MSIERIAVVEGLRTPFIKSWTLFNDIPAQDLGVICVRELINKTGLSPDDIDEVILGCAGQPAEAMNIARVVSLRSGIPYTKTAFTVNRNCASGFESLISACEKIRCGVDKVVIAGGTESMSNIPMLFPKRMANRLLDLQKAKTVPARIKALLKFRPADFKPIAGLRLGLMDSFCGLGMGQTAEILAKEFAITRAEQDAFALDSHKKAVAAKTVLREEITPVFIPPEYKTAAEDDNGPRENQSAQALAKLKAVFERKTGTVTAGNSSQITDGSAALVVMPETLAKSRFGNILGCVRDYVTVGLDPSRMGLGPVFAIEALLRKNQLRLSDIDLIEINEAFAVQVLASMRALASDEFAKNHFPGAKAPGKINPEILNVNGGAIAIGHPIGSSGTRLILTCLKEMKRRGCARGLVSLCVGGGQGSAILLER